MCALISKSSTKLTLQQTVSMDFKIAFQQCMVHSKMVPDKKNKNKKIIIIMDKKGVKIIVTFELIM